MRFSKKGGSVDLDKAESEIMEAYKSGVNYFDTAYIYPGSEAALGQILEKNQIRSKVNIATKLPQYLAGSLKAVDKFFAEELLRLRTDYIDYYLMHMFTSPGQWDKLKTYGIEEWIAQRKQEGSIRQIGFSFHGNTADFLEILNAYDWDFCQIQYNYIDEFSQAGVEGLKAAAAKGIPVIIMEPLRGGKLVNQLPREAKELIGASAAVSNPAELAFRWLWDQPEVTCVLSGMNSMEMVRENCEAASAAETSYQTGEEKEIISQIKKIISRFELVRCTGCRYCMPCPRGVDIPMLFACYNRTALGNKGSARKEYFQNVGLRREPAFATRCIGCGKCESHCPQGIPIIQKLKEADRTIRPLPYKIAISVARKFLKL